MDCINDLNLWTCRRWLFLAVGALSVSGICSVAVVLLRLPFFAQYLVSPQHVFDTALVLHVDMSVMVWMYAISALVMSITVDSRLNVKKNYYGWVIALVGTLLMALSVFIPDTEVIKSDYIPVLRNPVFAMGLMVFFCGWLPQCHASLSRTRVQFPVLNSGIVMLGIMFMVAVACFVMSLVTMPQEWLYSADDLYNFYESLFWGGGHIMQLAFAQAMFVIYLFMYGRVFSPLHARVMMLMMAFNVLITIVAPFMYFVYGNSMGGAVSFFTMHMIFAGALTPLLILVSGYGDFSGMLRFIRGNVAFSCSLLLFTYGGILGLMAVNGNVIIPAHYHGSIVGMTVAFMGFAYWILPKLGLIPIRQSIANIQIILYSIGQFLHVSALQIMGGYGALRKASAGVPDAVSVFTKAMFAFGGLCAVTGGIIFVLLMVRSFVAKNVGEVRVEA